jgi:acetyltransferase-like isoleucine patch superfamily enzyme
VAFWPGMIPTELLCHPGAELLVGADSQFNYGSSFESSGSIRIGARCMFGSFVRVSDRDRDRSGSIVIGDDVWVAHGAVIEPGVTVGSGSVVSANSVVTADVPSGCLAIGNPARFEPISPRR